MGLDIRWPIGSMFSLIGVLLLGCGILDASDSMSLGINVNLIWGFVLLIFGGVMLVGPIRNRLFKAD